MNDTPALTILQLLDGAQCVNVRLSGKAPWCPAVWPSDPAERRQLIEAHLSGGSASVTLCPNGKSPKQTHIQELQLSAYCPASDGLCRWINIDLDGLTHGPKGLADPVKAARVIVERCHDLGLGGGVLVSTSRNGGRHVWIISPAPCSLTDGVLAVSAIAAAAFDAADRDLFDSDGDLPHAFATGDGTLAELGDAGAVELIPRSDERPRLGWSMTLPRELRDPFDDRPTEMHAVPRCDPAAWAALIADARRAIRPAPRRCKRTIPRRTNRTPRPLETVIARLPDRAREFLAGMTVKGGRNAAAYATACSLFRFGVPEGDVLQLVMAGADGCGLPPTEATAAVRSARKAVRR